MNEYIAKAQESASKALHEGKALIGDFLPEGVPESIAQQENLSIIAILSILALLIGFKIFNEPCGILHP
ncbi:hypothetical protein OTK49_02175 [Vibrio coralliirubri]|uniref:hypothetical protein n=1 Tax=Vibrio coralliirubri TaxID=1516159 RepID=UPI00228355E3|nr:hypothetical protein [Vibrio coralliirubri]MCY9861322.1 hypothetical protein [Vibrio coralliirubri]